MLKRLCTYKLTSAFPNLYLTSCSNRGGFYDWVLVVGAGRCTCVWSECIVTYECNIKKKNPVCERVHCMGIGVQREGSNVIL